MAVFPYRLELDQSGALLRALEPACLPSRTTSGVSRSRSRASARESSCRPETSRRLPSKLRTVLEDPEPFRAGARRAREELTWAASARHLDLYCELSWIFRRRRYGELVERDLDLFASEDGELLDDVDRALERYNAAEADEAEDLYGDYHSRSRRPPTARRASSAHLRARSRIPTATSPSSTQAS